VPKLTIQTDQGERSADVPSGTRLVLAIEEQGVQIGHRCGGNARCTTCRVEVAQGEPDTMTRAEYEILKTRELLGQVRLACQLVADHDMTVKPLMTVENQGWDSPGGPPDPAVQPDRQTFPRSELEQGSGS
jgi:ferredoxin